MNSEELEQSLRVEFESYLRRVLENMQANVTEFQSMIDSEFEKHRSKMNDEFRAFSERFQNMPDFEGGFRESVLEHLRLARDEGAKITATAIAEAEELEKATSPAVDLAAINDAINDISSKDSQSSILKTLIQHAARYTPRGAFFIIKNEHFVGWRVFGKEAAEAETAIREIHFPAADDSILGGAVRALATVEGSFGTYTDDVTFLDPLHFGRPDRMYAIPLVARGRGVAVLYCDYGHEGVMVNTDALEMLVKVAGLTVELLASAKPAKPESHSEPSHDLSASYYDIDEAKPARPVETPIAEAAEYTAPPAPIEPVTYQPAPETFTELPGTGALFTVPPGETVEPSPVFSPPVFTPPVFETPLTDYDFKSQFDTAPEYVPEPGPPPFEPAPSFEDAEFETTQPFAAETGTFNVLPDERPAVEEHGASHDIGSPVSSYSPGSVSETESFFDPATTRSIESFEPTVAPPVFEPSTAFEQAPYSEPTTFEPNPFDGAASEPVAAPNGGPAAAPAPVVETVPARPAGGRLSDRQVDLPIEVAEDERRLHNDARRFARLLVSEIKLYNEKKVQEGRESRDLYERLREAIDRSREMYDKRVQPPVASKFDYFHYELVNSLAEGDEARLGPGYKGANI